MLGVNPEEPSSSAQIGGVQDMMAHEDMTRASHAFNCVVRARDISDRISPSDMYQKCDGVNPVADLGKVMGNMMLLGVNQVRMYRAERLLMRAESLLGISFADMLQKDE